MHNNEAGKALLRTLFSAHAAEARVVSLRAQLQGANWLVLSGAWRGAVTVFEPLTLAHRRRKTSQAVTGGGGDPVPRDGGQQHPGVRLSRL